MPGILEELKETGVVAVKPRGQGMVGRMVWRVLCAGPVACGHHVLYRYHV